jgi:hypothetical protein
MNNGNYTSVITRGCGTRIPEGSSLSHMMLYVYRTIPNVSERSQKFIII